MSNHFSERRRSDAVKVLAGRGLGTTIVSFLGGREEELLLGILGDVRQRPYNPLTLRQVIFFRKRKPHLPGCH